MKLTEIRIKNFRSIIDTNVVSVNQVTVIVGKNNQGKSNFIKAIDIAFQAISHFSMIGSIRARRTSIYDYERDFPFFTQCSGQSTEVFLRFSINDDESKKLYNITSMKLSNYLNAIVSICEDSRITIKYSKRGATGLEKFANDISRFILSSINFINIHAVRTESDSINVINQLIQNRMRFIDEDREYSEAMKVINRKEEEVLKEISNSTTNSLKTFLKEVKKVDISLDDYRTKPMGFYYGRRFNMKIDDGISTDLQYKGDGIKSLTALALLKDTKSSSSTSIIAIEEPESHLHSGAIHSLNDILRNISSTTQLIITTHNPLFISRNSLDSNIIIRNNSAFIPKNIKELREELGVLASDNLVNAELVVLVEGDTDVKILTALIRYYNTGLSEALDSNRLIIKSVNGASKITQDLYYFKNMMCKIFVILDNDNAAKEALKNARDKKLLEENEYNIIRNESDREFELEDLIQIEVYKNDLEEHYGIDLNRSKFKSKKKWSNRMKSLFASQAKVFDDQTEKDCKIRVANLIEKKPEAALNEYHLSIFTGIMDNILNKLEYKENDM